MRLPNAARGCAVQQRHSGHHRRQVAAGRTDRTRRINKAGTGQRARNSGAARAELVAAEPATSRAISLRPSTGPGACGLRSEGLVNGRRTRVVKSQGPRVETGHTAQNPPLPSRSDRLAPDQGRARSQLGDWPSKPGGSSGTTWESQVGGRCVQRGEHLDSLGNVPPRPRGSLLLSPGLLPSCCPPETLARIWGPARR